MSSGLFQAMVLSSFYVLLASYFLGAAESAGYSPAEYAGPFNQGIRLPLTRVRRPIPQFHTGVLASDVSIQNSHE